MSNRRWRTAGLGGAAIAAVLSAGLLSGCVADPPTATAANRALGTPASDELEDLNKWVSNVAVISGDVSFETGLSQLTPEGERILTELAPHLQDTSGSILVEGFADGVGGDSEANDTLSRDRAEEAKTWLTHHASVDANRFLDVIGHGTSGIVNGVEAIDGVSDAARRVVQITVN